MNILEQAATLLGGHVSNGQILCPGPNHGHEDRSLSIKLDPTHPDGFVYHSFAGDELETCRTFIKSKIGHLLSGYVSQSDPGNRAKLQFLTATTDEGLYEAASRVMSGVNPDHIYLYRDETGQVIVQAVARWDDIKGKKEIRPFIFTETGWKCRALPASRPLLNLDQIASISNSDVLIVEGEKTAEAAAECFDGITTTWAGGSQAVDKTNFSVLAGRNVYLCPDNDDAGRKAMDQVAECLQQFGAHVQIVDLKVLAQHRPNGPELSEGWDLADASDENWNPQSINKAIRSSVKSVAAVAAVAQVGGAKPISLFDAQHTVNEYPVEALGPLMGNAVAAIARKIQVPEALAAQSVLATASLVVQAHGDVLMPYGQKRPASIFCITVAESGDRKTTADNEALKGVKRSESELAKRYKSEYRDYEINDAAYQAEKRRIESNRHKKSLEEKKDELRKLGPKPEKPLRPDHIIKDPTIEGLIKNMNELRASIGLFSNEGGQFTGGYGMTDEHRLKTAANLSALWDAEPIKRLRAGDGATNILGHRLCIHLMLQPDASQQLLGSSVLRDQGLLSRLLISASPSLAGTRFYREPLESDEVAIQTFANKTFELLQVDPHLVEGSRNEVAPRTIPLSEEARKQFYDFSDSLEMQMGAGGELSHLKDFASKAPENAARIATVLALFENVSAPEISLDLMTRGIELMDWYLGEISRLHEIGRTDPQIILAQTLLDWIRARDFEVISEREISRNGPRGTRRAKNLRPVLAVLCDHNWLISLGAGQYRLNKTGDA